MHTHDTPYVPYAAVCAKLSTWLSSTYSSTYNLACPIYWEIVAACRRDLSIEIIAAGHVSSAESCWLLQLHRAQRKASVKMNWPRTQAMSTRSVQYQKTTKKVANWRRKVTVVTSLHRTAYLRRSVEDHLVPGNTERAVSTQVDMWVKWLEKVEIDGWLDTHCISRWLISFMF